MDFEIALYVSGTITAFSLAAALVVYGIQIRRIFVNVGPNTRKALIHFGISGALTFIVTMAGLFWRGFFLSWMGFFFAFIISTILYVLYPDSRKASLGRAAVMLLASLMVLENSYRFFIDPNFTSMMEYLGVTILLTGSFVYAIVLVRDTPSAFTGSILLILVLYVITAATAATSFIFIHHEYFIIQSTPILVSAAVFGSIRRPWRAMISIFIVLLFVSMSGGLLWGAYLAGEMIIFQFTIIALFAGLCIVAPLNFFVQQGVDTGARTPQLIGNVLIALSLLVATHTNSWAVYQSVTYDPVKPALVWNEWFVSVDVILGVIAIMSFLMAAGAASFGARTYGNIRDAALITGTGIVVLGLYPVRLERWQASMLYPIMAVFILIGVVIFARVSFRIYKAGASRAAQNFMTFILSSLVIGIITMYSDQIQLELVYILLVMAGLLALASSPPIIASITRRFRRGSTQIPENVR